MLVKSQFEWRHVLSSLEMLPLLFQKKKKLRQFSIKILKGHLRN